MFHPFGQPKVVARTRLKLCRARECPGSCRALHLCKKFLLTGSCPFTRSRTGCKFSHELNSDHNAGLLRAHKLESLSRAKLCTLLLQSDNWLLPEICRHYNNGGGEFGLCQEGFACKRLHICERFLNYNCSCSKAHDFNSPQPYKSLQEKGVPEDLTHSLKSVYANILALKYADRKQLNSSTREFSANPDGLNRRQRPRPVRDKTEICMFFIKGHCKDEERCFKAHDKMPYRWEAGGRKVADVDSPTLEQKFLDNDKDVVEFTAGSQSYSLSFQDMIQTNKEYGTKRLVKRRPLFVSAADVKTKKARRPPGQLNLTAVPDHWDKTQIPQTGYKRVPLQRSSDELKESETVFCKTMRGFDIVQIERIQNKALWEVFQWYVGSYFARDAEYSHSYTGDSDVKSLFISRVLVGDYTRGSSDYVRPPSKDGGDINFYDSCVDDVISPSIFVVFEKHQIYPEYLLQYKSTQPPVDLFGTATASYPEPVHPMRKVHMVVIDTADPVFLAELDGE
ncbi:hypothetical protein PFLUV_G00266370 [Perca fluviatilis]|uniref:Poly [ADP-ribose] polymerase n=1 Tax=Perca fluviatilis TaxID=8168 RepID=A0A6A5DNQ4_PERFL|nr:hypothetical protein PFLUV_G00266370 [Perca fluviatilis]